LWSEQYEALSGYEKGEFRRLCNYLLSRTYMVRETYRPDKERTEYNSDYRMAVQLFACMRDYFAFSGWRLEKDDNYGVLSLVSECEHNHLRVDRFTTLFLYTCRLLYEEEREKGDNLKIVRTDTGRIIEKMRLLGLLENGRSTQKERLQAQRTLAHFNIIQKTETTAWHPDGNTVLIFPSILSIVSNQGINDMMLALAELQAEDTETAQPTGSDEGDEA
jgi:hypothetical protein